jgi:hypothetical protein
LVDRDDLAGAGIWFAAGKRSGHPEWSAGGLIGQAHPAARDRRPEHAAGPFRQVIAAGREQFAGSAWYNLAPTTSSGGRTPRLPRCTGR